MMQRRFRNVLFAVTALAAMAAASSARAGFHLGAEILVNGTPIFTEFEGGAFDLNPSSHTFTLDVAGVNPLLAAFDLELDSLRLFSNTLPGAPGFGAESILSQTGAVRYLGEAGSALIEIRVTSIDYTFPNPAAVMESSTSATFTTAGGGNQTQFQSFFGPGNFYFDMSVDAPLLTLLPPPGLSGSASATADATFFDFGPPYSLTNVARITVGPTSAEIGWSGSTVVAIPEPASAGLVLALLAAGLLARRRGTLRGTRLGHNHRGLCGHHTC